MRGRVCPTRFWRSYDEADVWNWVLIVGCYAFAAFFLRLLGGFNSAADAISRWGRHTSIRRISRVDSRYRVNVK